jgi:predicted RecB family nuclease
MITLSMFSATAIANFLACHHIATLDRAEERKEVTKPFFNDPTIDMLRKLGLDHEQQYLRQLSEKNGLTVVQIDVNSSWDAAVAETVQAIRGGADAIYQATFLEGQWGGRSDFLVRLNKPSSLGAWSYEVVETKLARSTKAGAIVQLCFYSDLLSRIQGVEPQLMHAVLGGGVSPERFPVQRYVAYFRKVRSEFEKAQKIDTQTYPEPVEHCDVCSWLPVCDERWRSDDYLSLVAGITRNQRKHLGERGVGTVVSLANLVLPVRPKIERIGDAALVRIHEQASIQVKGREEGRLLYELLEPAEDDRGLCVLPLPSSGDVFLDLESNPYVLDQGLEYLIGFLTLSPDPDVEPGYEALWAFDHAEEKQAFEAFIERVMDRWQRDPSMHIYHYAPYEPTAIKRLAGRHGTCVDEVDELLRAGIFVDLFRVVRQGLRASVESYSIKRLEPLYGFARTVPLRDANLALGSYEAALALGDSPAELGDLLKTIEGYNRDDCVSAFKLRSWLEDRRSELEKRTKKALPRPTAKSGKPGLELAAAIDEVAELKACLLDPLPTEGVWTEQHRACWLLAQMLEWHRREEKSAWWEYYRLCDLSTDELLEDKSALGGLIYIGEVERVKRSVIHRYRFPPQDHTIGRALKVHDPRTKKGAGEFLGIDDRNCTIDLSRAASSSVPHPAALVPLNVIDPDAMEASLLRLAIQVANHGIAGSGRLKAARDLLLRRRPSALKGEMTSLIGENGYLTQAAKELVRTLANEPSVLPIQGPPGTGKTFTGARMIVELVKQGRRVGITAVSHKVISNLLREVCRASVEMGVTLRAVQKANEEDACRNPMVQQAESNEAVLDALANGTALVAAGTAWLWARAEMAQSVDVLVVDEAAQMALANTLAVSQAATSIALLGDPQQLDQPQQGVHPPGAEVSALGHLLRGRATIGTDEGLFLAETRRLHPDVCAFTSELFYDGRLTTRPENKNQRLTTEGPLDGTGVRFAPVEHAGNQNESPEEVAKVAALVDGLLKAGTTWTNKKGETLRLRFEDILIVAPYNAQVSALVQRLPAGARIGTVDKFQGQEAPIVLYSMATSTPEDAPRGMEFLYSLNRLNVATSRAQCVAVIVASPALFQVQCKTPRQIELANAFCRYIELARLAGG